MGVYNLNPEASDDTGVKVAGSTGTVTDPESTGEIKPEETGIAATGKETAETKTVVLNGPLSHIYSQALNVVYANESQANDVIMLTDTIISNQEKQPVDLYVHVCGVDDLENGGLPGIFNDLRIAAADENIKQRMVVIESNGVITSKMVVLENFLTANGISISHKRTNAIEGIVDAIKRH